MNTMRVWFEKKIKIWSVGSVQIFVGYKKFNFTKIDKIKKLYSFKTFFVG